jgi:hypothetical protein
LAGEVVNGKLEVIWYSIPVIDVGRMCQLGAEMSLYNISGPFDMINAIIRKSRRV